jgi:uracil-DNA glycosylase family 4
LTKILREAHCGEKFMTRRMQMLDGLEIGPVWVRRTASEVTVAMDSAEKAVDVPPATSLTSLVTSDDVEVATMDWETLKETVSTCTRCALSRSRNRTVFGVGDTSPEWLFVGEGPGSSEDRSGEPFVGPAGVLLDNILGAMKLRRGDKAFIANIVKCRPTDEQGKDRAPRSDEIAACKPFIERQIALLKPAMMIALGKTAAIALVNVDPETTVSSLRGRIHLHDEIPVVVTYHPAYLLRVPADKRKTWEDLCLAMQHRAKRGDDHLSR